ncbi:hypothetical protein [Sinorhizobium terangae]|uniref:hypothetical protein n=1 Tax=Sinorhizobium terangae TaxID=110322 RepID=UPI0024B060D6|nr:hypothetical protein [Sinorhizobium terangae]WFU51158.1 hypothetical protein QA637_21445 [Sinorhizobium terangae]
MKRAEYRSIAERIILPLPKGMRDAIDAACLDGEVRVAFIRTAIKNELDRRRREKDAT